MPEQLYKRITLDGDVNRLPKEDGKYFVGFAMTEGTAHYIKDNPGNRRYWLDQIDYYLIPFTPDSKAVIMPTPGEVYKEAEWRATNGHGALDDYSMSIFINACEWFRSQVREVELKTEIEKFSDFKDTMKKVYDLTERSLVTEKYLSARKEGK